LVLAVYDCNGSTPDCCEFVLGGNTDKRKVGNVHTHPMTWNAGVICTIDARILYVLLNTDLALGQIETKDLKASVVAEIGRRCAFVASDIEAFPEATWLEAERVGDDDVAALVWAARQRHANASSPISCSALFQGQSGGYNHHQQQQQLLTWT